jgi:hypothetical protein
MASVSVVTKVGRVADVLRAIAALQGRRVMVGFPSGTAPRARRRGQAPTEMNNATLAYIHNNGSPARNIPARPFLEPGIRSIEVQAAEILRDAARRELAGEPGALERGLNRVGLLAQGAVQQRIVEGPFVPLAPTTVRRKGSSRPLIDTGQMRQSVTYVIRDT